MALDSVYTILQTAGVLGKPEGWASTALAPDLHDENETSEHVVTVGSAVLGQRPGMAQVAAITLLALVQEGRRKEQRSR